MIKNLKICFLGVIISVATMQFAKAQNNGGLGVSIILENGFPKITRVEPGMPAQRMNLAPNDFITTIDGLSTQNLSIYDIINKLRGPLGSSCDLVIWRAGTEYPVSFIRESFPIANKPVENNYGTMAIIDSTIGLFLEGVFGDNIISEYLLKEAVENGYNYITK